MRALSRLAKFARRSPYEHIWAGRRMVLQQAQTIRARIRYGLPALLGRPVSYNGRERTTYIVGLFGSGRWYLNELIVRHLRERAEYYFKDTMHLRAHPGPTALIYSGHATIKHVAWGQALPSVTARLSASLRTRHADLIFIYRHPLDSLLSNWVWVREYTRRKSFEVRGITAAYRSTEDLCAALEQNFAEFRAFAEGDPAFSASLPRLRHMGQEFLSFRQFVEETALFIEYATLSLRFEDFMVDPHREFSRIAELMSADVDVSSLPVARPETRPYRYKTVAQKVPHFRRYIDELDALTRTRIEKLGYELAV
jgi:hypothetical protein